MTVILTEKAAFRLRSFLRGSGDSSSTEKGLRVAAIDGGCQGYEYALDVVSQPSPDDLKFEQDKVTIYIDPKSAPLLEGVVIDFVESLMNTGFTFTNPNATDTCGCGKSFSAGDCTPSAVPCS
ncbi:iron-sulfur cluster assembly accessory protein [Oscillatoria sp. FACHB-1406]|uniref:HesB/IscA family protein n=1 Tax=Oscillatoria sp. FACHB-1406 TaxID=2692846 RepID=UPI001684AC4A|nr:iron-sulfur cluster assembly accessory protein [Oscillatoria sp. FACHB-1406]MBD2577798.1 iron-sulfur cluster assembly accessory protein [Oscillatoria sp. FACHB-1406]